MQRRAAFEAVFSRGLVVVPIIEKKNHLDQPFCPYLLLIHVLPISNPIPPTHSPTTHPSTPHPALPEQRYTNNPASQPCSTQFRQQQKKQKQKQKKEGKEEQ